MIDFRCDGGLSTLHHFTLFASSIGWLAKVTRPLEHCYQTYRLRLDAWHICGVMGVDIGSASLRFLIEAPDSITMNHLSWLGPAAKQWPFYGVNVGFFMS